jgi:hypothetical protein
MSSPKILLAGTFPDGTIKPTDEKDGYPMNTEDRNAPCFR